METDLIKTGFFKREERIKNPADFKNLFKTGKKISIPDRGKSAFVEDYSVHSWVSSSEKIFLRTLL